MVLRHFAEVARLDLTRFSIRRQHRRIAAQVLTRQAVVGFGPTLEYETDVLLRSLYEATQGGKTPVDPAHHVGRFTLKSAFSFFSSHLLELSNIFLFFFFPNKTATCSLSLVQRGRIHRWLRSSRGHLT